MYDFWYNYVKRRYPTAELLMTDTDSVLFSCNTEDIYDDMKSSLDLFDTSDYPKSHPLYSTRNTKCVGKLKDETFGRPIEEFAGLRAKMYSFVCNETEQKRAKGISKVTVKKDLKHAHYKNTLLKETKMTSSMTAIRSHSHKLFCEKIKKTSLSAFDDKRYLINATESLAYGHYKITSQCQTPSGDNDQNSHGDCIQTIEGDIYSLFHDESYILDQFKVTPCIKQ